jgi:hypothetical protein
MASIAVEFIPVTVPWIVPEVASPVRSGSGEVELELLKYKKIPPVVVGGA